MGHQFNLLNLKDIKSALLEDLTISFKEGEQEFRLTDSALRLMKGHDLTLLATKKRTKRKLNLQFPAAKKLKKEAKQPKKQEEGN